MAAEFETAVEKGILLTKRLYYGKEPVAVPPKLQSMLKSSSAIDSHLPRAISLYAVVQEPEAVDNPDVPSYQPYVLGKCDPAALIPLPMTEPVQMDVKCWLEHAIVSLTSSWRVHCIKAGRRCQCLLALPLEKPGSLLGVDIVIEDKQYKSKFAFLEENNENKYGSDRKGAGRYINGNIYTIEMSQVEAASVISVTATWSQQLTYSQGEFFLKVPFTFPSYVNPINNSVLRKEQIMLSVFPVTGQEIILTGCSHAIEEISRESGVLGCLYKSLVSHWSTSDFRFAYEVFYSDIYGTALSQSQNLIAHDDKNIVCFHIFPGNSSLQKSFKKDIVFLIDISKSMEGTALEVVKDELLYFLNNLAPQDSFNIIVFNEESALYSPSMIPVSRGAISKAVNWINDKLIADGGTNMFLPLQQALKLLGNSVSSIPLIFLITDGTVDDERIICKFAQDSPEVKGAIAPRIYTFGIGSYCNHYFLRMLAQIGRGHFGCSYDSDSINPALHDLLAMASSTVLASITMSEKPEELELFPSDIPDLSSESPLTLVGKYKGSLPDTIKLKGILPDMSNFTLEVNVEKTTAIPLDRVYAGRFIEAETSRAWLLQDKDIEHKVASMSLLHGVPSEYTRLILVSSQTVEHQKVMITQKLMKKIILVKDKNQDEQSIKIGCSCVGFGDRTATLKNVPLKNHFDKEPGSAEKLVSAASEYFHRVFGPCWCCVFVIGSCSTVSRRSCGILAQICAALACTRCLECCYELCAE